MSLLQIPFTTKIEIVLDVLSKKILKPMEARRFGGSTSFRGPNSTTAARVIGVAREERRTEES
jgi:hypothetical protein